MPNNHLTMENSEQSTFFNLSSLCFALIYLEMERHESTVPYNSK